MVATPLRWTTQDLDNMPDDGGWKRYEIIDGTLFVTHAPHLGHQSILGNIYSAIEAWSRSAALGKTFPSPGVTFTPTDAVIPDVIWISTDRLSHGLDEAGHITIAPELIVEVLSPGDSNEQRDLDLKLKLYSRHGVQEYWIANWQLKTLEIYRLNDSHLQLTATLVSNETLTSPLLPGFTAQLAQLF